MLGLANPNPSPNPNPDPNQACLKSGNAQQAQQVVQGMRSAGFVPDSNLYDALLLGCAQHGEPVATIQRFLQQMQQARWIGS